MASPHYVLTALVLFLTACHVSVYGQRFDGQYWACNPMKNLTCPPNVGLNQFTYNIDFTKPPSDLSKDWSTSNYAKITYNTKDKNGAEFTYGKRYDAPQLFTNFYIFYGRVDVEMQVAPGTGIISSSVLMSDDFDEIDWEMSGNNFNLAAQYPGGVVQNNYFSKGITGAYDRGAYEPCPKPQTTFHTYSVDWTPSKLDWLIDGKVMRTFLAAKADSTTHQYPQTPSKIQLGIWAGGDPGENTGTIHWAGGITNISAAPYTMFVRNVRITNYNPARYYNWTDQSGSSKSIKAQNSSLPSSVTTKTASTATTPMPLQTDLPISPNGHCGKDSKKICKGSLFGDCCSFYGYCGNTTEYCGLGCQSGFGICGPQNPAATTGVTSSPTSTSTPQSLIGLSPLSSPTSSLTTQTSMLSTAQMQTPTASGATPPTPSALREVPSAMTPNSPGSPTSLTTSNKGTTTAVLVNSDTRPTSLASPTTLKPLASLTSMIGLNPSPESKTTTKASPHSVGTAATSPSPIIAAAIGSDSTTNVIRPPAASPSPTSMITDGLAVRPAKAETATATSESQSSRPKQGARELCIWWGRWYCFHYKRAYPVGVQADRGIGAR
ncbi:concanavalin A-like lectin/glucanase domain-containing protein [Xylariaceae sp. FL0016]|nr:concanavalin A-like lectin/glucanase domain-containing protein [Xylariaceae sp. FL0016]